MARSSKEYVQALLILLMFVAVGLAAHHFGSIDLDGLFALART